MALISGEVISGGRRAPWTLNFAVVAAVIFAPGYLPYLGDPLENNKVFLSFLLHIRVCLVSDALGRAIT